MTTEEQNFISNIIDEKLELIILKMDSRFKDIKNDLTKNQADMTRDVQKAASKGVWKSMTTFLVLFVLVMTGSFSYTAKVETKVADHHRQTVKITTEVEELNSAMRTVSGTLYQENRESLILKGMYEYYNKPRGLVASPWDDMEVLNEN